MEDTKRCCGIALFIGLLLALGLLLTAFAAPYWSVDSDVSTHTGVWKSCTTLGVCSDLVEVMDLVDRDDVARALQAMMCLALISAIIACIACVIWIVEPESTPVRIVTCVCVILAGTFIGISIGLFGMMYSETVNALTLILGGGGTGSAPSGWAYYVAIAASVVWGVLGMVSCCCACQGNNDSGRVSNRSHGGYGGLNGYGGRGNPSYGHNMQRNGGGPREGMNMAPGAYQDEIPMHNKVWTTSHGPRGPDPVHPRPGYPPPRDLYNHNGYYPGAPPPDPAYPPGYTPRDLPPAYSR